jgi:vacuolar protein sorting-associated protein 54
MQVDIAHLQSKLAKIEGASDLGDKLLGLVNAKHIAEAPAEPEKPEKTDSANENQDSDKGAESSSS